MLMEMLDNINFSMRDDVLKFAASGNKTRLEMRMEMQPSPRYTTRWDELYKSEMINPMIPDSFV